MVRGGYISGGGLPLVQTLLQEIRGGLLLLSAMGEEEDFDDEPVLVL